MWLECLRDKKTRKLHKRKIKMLQNSIKQIP